jgi:hypothetical protein
VLFNSGQPPACRDGMLQRMELHTIKGMIATAWLTITLIVALSAQVAWPLQFAFAALGLLPPLALLLLWNEPDQTMTQAINEVRRGR